MKKTTDKKLRSQNGMVLSIITYSMLILVAAYGAASYISSVNGGNQIRKTLSSLQAQYQAYKGIEYAYRALMDSAFSSSPFITHKVSSTCYDTPSGSCSLAAVDPLPTNPFTIGSVGNDGYTSSDSLDSNDVNNRIGFRIKTYRNGDDIIVLSKGYYKGQTKLFVSKVLGNDAYKYFMFFQGDVNLGNQTLDVGGAKIQVNGAIQLTEKLTISNANLIQSAGPIYMAYTPHIRPEDEGKYAMYRSPWWTPDVATGYLNNPDGHFAGDLYGIYTLDPTSTKFIPWNSQSSLRPISPEPWFTCGNYSCNNHIAVGNTTWQSVNPLMATAYQQKVDGNGISTASIFNVAREGYVNNEDYNSNFPNINGKYIPSWIYYDSPTYLVPKYRGVGCSNQDSDTNCIRTNLLNSAKQPDTWNTFISRFPKQVTADSITGFKDPNNSNLDVMKIGTNTYITPPRMDQQKLADAAGMKITKDNAGNIKVAINGGTPISVTDAGVGCGSSAAFTKRTFMNSETALKNDVVEINVEALMACAGNTPGSDAYKKWIPSNNIIYADYGVALSHASKLPTNGLTAVVHGNLILQGPYNTETDHWQPSAAIISDYTYLVSKDFNWPSQLPVSQHHSDYPYPKTYNGVTLPAGKDYTTGYNWLSDKDASMASKVTGSVDYNISLIGKDGYNPRFLERWKYYANPGSAVTPPSNLVNYTATVTGAFIQLAPGDFAEADKPPYPINPRLCSDTTLKADISGTPLASANYPCRTNVNYPPEDFVAFNDNEIKKYEKRYATSNTRPPGSYLGLIPSSLLEIADTNDNWTKHNIQFFPLIQKN